MTPRRPRAENQSPATEGDPGNSRRGARTRGCCARHRGLFLSCYRRGDRGSGRLRGCSTSHGQQEGSVSGHRGDLRGLLRQQRVCTPRTPGPAPRTGLEGRVCSLWGAVHLSVWPQGAAPLGDCPLHLPPDALVASSRGSELVARAGCWGNRETSVLALSPASCASLRRSVTSLNLLRCDSE